MQSSALRRGVARAKDLFLRLAIKFDGSLKMSVTQMRHLIFINIAIKKSSPYFGNKVNHHAN